MVEFTPDVATAAGALARNFILGGADGVHLASAIIMAEAVPILVSWNLRLALRRWKPALPSRI